MAYFGHSYVDAMKVSVNGFRVSRQKVNRLKNKLSERARNIKKNDIKKGKV